MIIKDSLTKKSLDEIKGTPTKKVAPNKGMYYATNSTKEDPISRGNNSYYYYHYYYNNNNREKS